MSDILLSAVLNGAILSMGLVAILSIVFRAFGSRFWNASTRYAVWLVALVITAALPAIYAIHSLRDFDSPAVAGSSDELALPGLAGHAEITGNPDELNTPNSLANDNRSRHEGFSFVQIPAGPWTFWILAAWGCASAVMLMRLAVSYVWLHRCKARTFPAPAGIRPEPWLKLCGSVRRVGVAASEELAAPVAAGPFRPLILIPAPLFDELGWEELEQIGVHEAAHFARRDDYALLFQRVCEAIFVFHPGVRWITARMDIEREIACDDFVVEVTGRPRPYAECLTRVAAFAGGLIAPSLAAPAVESPSVLERRLDMLLDKNRKTAPRLLKAPMTTLVALTAALIWTVLAGPQLVAFATQPAEPAIAYMPVMAAPVPPAPAAAPAGSQQVRSAVATPAAPQNANAPSAEARDNLNKGVQAFKSGDFENAVNLFGRAAQLAPDWAVAQIYLGTAYASMYVPGKGASQDYAYRAIQTFEGVLNKDPRNVDALVGLANVYQNRLDFRAARENFLKAAPLAPQNPTIFYTIGAVDWIIVFDKANPPTAQEQAQLIAEGLESLDKALAIDPLYDEAMTYKNLLLRERARIAPSSTDRTALLAEADAWFNKALQTRQQNAQTGRQRSLPSTAGLTVPMVAPPAPPPPPPPPGGRTAVGNATNPNSPLRIGGDVAQSNLLYQVKPIYPALARAARVQDYVMLQATISADGIIKDLKILHGHELLNDAAIDAVRQWQYKPQTLNGQPIEVITTITVNFSFQ